MNEILDANDEELNARIRSTLNAVADSLSSEATLATSDTRSYRGTMMRLSVAAVLAVAMLGASFAWNSKDKKTDIALAAYAEPHVLTKLDKESLIERCKVPVRKEFAGMHGSQVTAYWTPGGESPVYVDSRGSVSIAVYGGGTDSVVCSEASGNLEVSHTNFASAFRMSFPMQTGSSDPGAPFPAGVFLTKGELAFQKYSTFGKEGVLVRGGFETREVLHQFVLNFRSGSQLTPVKVSAMALSLMPGLSTSMFVVWLPLPNSALETDLVDKITATDWRGVPHVLWDSHWDSEKGVPATSTSVPNVEK